MNDREKITNEEEMSHKGKKIQFYRARMKAEVVDIIFFRKIMHDKNIVFKLRPQ